MTLHSLRVAVLVRGAFAIFCAAAFMACASFKGPALKTPSAPLRTVPYVDLARFMGNWRVIANIPSFAEKECFDVIQSYALRPDGKIESWFTYRKKSFAAPQKTSRAQAVVTNHETNAEWRVKAFGFVPSTCLVIDLDPNYQWAVIGHPSRERAWILARERTLPGGTFEALLDRLAARGYDPGRFIKVPQPPMP